MGECCEGNGTIYKIVPTKKWIHHACYCSPCKSQSLQNTLAKINVVDILYINIGNVFLATDTTIALNIKVLVLSLSYIALSYLSRSYLSTDLFQVVRGAAYVCVLESVRGGPRESQRVGR